MRFTEGLHHDVVSTSTAATVGRVEGFVVRPAPARIVALRLGKTPTKDTLLDWSRLSAFGPDAVTVDSMEELHPAASGVEHDLADSSRDLLGKLALSEAGDGLGTVTDVEFDPASGAVLTIMTDRQNMAGDQLIGLGEYAAVFAVADPATRSTPNSN
ncbi:MAG TPA: hypothetical protein VHV82_11735 [Sporichthyaceae bacterium]|jgi:uncharacterized protein YrrD|nr:hypothetical protein [Sporichthyaceae bacterium]